MSDSVVFDKTCRLIGNSLDVAGRRHNLISSNIANADTIGYRPGDIDFRKTLERAMKGPGGDLAATHPKHFRDGARAGTPDMVLADNLSETVDIDVEMTHLAENNIRYRTSAEMLLRKLAIIRQAITEGGR